MRRVSKEVRISVLPDICFSSSVIVTGNASPDGAIGTPVPSKLQEDKIKTIRDAIKAEIDKRTAQLDRHLRDWHWMRDRDLLFEPWDTPERVVETALKTLHEAFVLPAVAGHG